MNERQTLTPQGFYRLRIAEPRDPGAQYLTVEEFHIKINKVPTFWERCADCFSKLFSPTDRCFWFGPKHFWDDPYFHVINQETLQVCLRCEKVRKV